jgi:hypothetical protein
MSESNFQDIYENFYKPRRLRLAESVGHLSAGLQARVFLAEWKSPENHTFKDLITFTAKHYLMGGAYYWVQKGTWKHPYSGSKIPLYGEPIPMAIDNIYPVDGDFNLGVGMGNNFFSVYRRTSRFEYTADEQLSEKYGIGLFDRNFARHPRIAKIELIKNQQTHLYDVVIGTNDWSDYQPTNPQNGKQVGWGDKNFLPFDDQGNWRGGPLHGKIYYYQNLGEDPEDPDSFRFADEVQIPGIDQYGQNSPVFADFSQHAVTDIICGDFLDNLTFFKGKPNTSIKGTPLNEFEPGTPILDLDLKPIKSYGVINYLIGCNFTGKGRTDLLVGSENGYITLLENTGRLSPEGVPLFERPIYLLQENPPLKADVLAVPAVSHSSNNAINIVTGTARGYFDFFSPVKDFQGRMHWHFPRIPQILPLDLKKGSIQGPSEIGWGYTCPTLFDWNDIGVKDLIFSDINGEHQVCLNEGTDDRPDFAPPKKLLDNKTGLPLTTVWRVRPTLIKNEGKIYYYCLDENAVLAQYERVGDYALEKRKNTQTIHGDDITFTMRYGGGQGRDKFQLFDWDQRGICDLLVGLPGGHNFRQLKGNEHYNHFPHATVVLFKNRGDNLNPIFDLPVYLTHKLFQEPLAFGQHSCSPEAFILENKVYLLVGCEDGHIY